jgi:hypothetical protein
MESRGGNDLLNRNLIAEPMGIASHVTVSGDAKSSSHGLTL